jgi:hypothetical protein
MSNDADQMSRFIDRGVDGIMTDDPLLLRQVIEERQALSSEVRFLLKIRAFLLAGRRST